MCGNDTLHLFFS